MPCTPPWIWRRSIWNWPETAGELLPVKPRRTAAACKLTENTSDKRHPHGCLFLFARTGLPCGSVWEQGLCSSGADSSAQQAKHQSQTEQTIFPHKILSFPNGAGSAFALGFDMDGDTIWKNKIRTLPNGEKYIKGPSIGLYGVKKGAYRILEILKEYNLKSSWFIPANIVKEHPDTVEAILDGGHEIGHHGLDHTGEYGKTDKLALGYVIAGNNSNTDNNNYF